MAINTTNMVPLKKSKCVRKDEIGRQTFLKPAVALLSAFLYICRPARLGDLKSSQSISVGQLNTRSFILTGISYPIADIGDYVRVSEHKTRADDEKRKKLHERQTTRAAHHHLPRKITTAR